MAEGRGRGEITTNLDLPTAESPRQMILIALPSSAGRGGKEVPAATQDANEEVKIDAGDQCQHGTWVALQHERTSFKRFSPLAPTLSLSLSLSLWQVHRHLHGPVPASGR